MIWMLLVLLTVLGGAAAVGIAVNERRKSLPGGGTPRALPATAESLVERTIRDVRVDDVLTIDGKDFLCEGVIAYDEDGHRWAGARVVDGAEIKWLVIGIERAGSSTRLFVQDETTQITSYPPEALVIGEIKYLLDKRGAATCRLIGDCGLLGDLKKGTEAHVERCRWWLYAAPGDDTVLVEQWGADYRVLRGKKVGEGTVELMAAS